MKRGYFGLALYRPKTQVNWGSLVRTATILDCKFIAVIGSRYPIQSADTSKAHRRIPVFEFDTFEEFKKFMPKMGCQLVGVELDPRAKELKDFVHPDRAIYMLGAEDMGIPSKIIDECNHLVKLVGNHSMNVACAGSIVLYHRQAL